MFLKVENYGLNGHRFINVAKSGKNQSKPNIPPSANKLIHRIKQKKKRDFMQLFPFAAS